MIFYRTFQHLDESVTEIPAGFGVYRIDMTGGTPDDDGRYRFSLWCVAPNEADARAAAEEHNAKANEGIVIDTIEQEDVS